MDLSRRDFLASGTVVAGASLSGASAAVRARNRTRTSGVDTVTPSVGETISTTGGSAFATSTT